MKCPNCGAQMKESSLYCEHCGEDIHIVPDFEPELDNDIQQTIKNIANDIWEEDDTKNILPEETHKQREKADTARKKKRRLIMLVTAVVLLYMMGNAAVFMHRYYSAEYQITKARECAEKELYDKAIRYYGRAIKLDEENVDLKVELAEIYFRKNNKMEYEYLLREIVIDENATQEQIESAYGKLIAIYRSRGDYQTINDFLLASNNSAVISAYQNYIAREPEFSVKEGNYTSIQPLKLSSFGSGKIYYTLDGSDPDENSLLYSAPILLEDGDYRIKAFYVSERGIYSNIVEKRYHIEVDELPSPEINIASGEYECPLNIEVMNGTEEVYYTTDGSEPTRDSTPYTSPIPMPLGTSFYKFIRIENGKASAVEERLYQLTLNTSITTEQAEKIVIDYCIRTGKIFDEAGYAESDSNSGERYEYRYRYVSNINHAGDFYVVMESLYDSDGTVTRTGTYFAVDIYTGNLFKLQIDDTGYTLTAVE